MNMNKTVVIAVIAGGVLILGVGLVFVLSSGSSPEYPGVSPQPAVSPQAEVSPPAEAEQLQEDTTVRIDEDLEEIDLGDLEEEFSDIDSDLESI
jgi:hypothetical protein